MAEKTRPGIPFRNELVFFLFVASGFCGLLYQVVWIRLAFAAFGVVTPVLSVVISVFMLGLAIGSWVGGRCIGFLTSRVRLSAIWFYACAETMIGIGAFVVPKTFAIGESWLLSAGEMDSTRYLVHSAMILAASLLPWCIMMGATFPLMMAYLRDPDPERATSFSFLYLANVIGAMGGTLLTALILIELLGFRRCLTIAGCTNFLIATIAATLGFLGRRSNLPTATSVTSAQEIATGNRLTSGPFGRGLLASVLFLTGFGSMAMEVVWTRAFTPVLRTTIYAFASLLAVYLFATWAGSWVYRYDLRRRRTRSLLGLLAIVSVSSFLPILVNDPRWDAPFYVKAALTLSSIIPFCAALGYLTPQLIDQYSCGAPRPAGLAYAVNIVGCVLGPLFAGYVLLPYLGIRHSLVLLGAMFPAFHGCASHLLKTPPRYVFATLAGSLGLILISLLGVISYEDSVFYKSAEIRRDHVATVVSCGEGYHKRLLVNGIGMTVLTQITKNMAHVPMAVPAQKPQSALVICLGMGTTLRSLASWDVRCTAVELVPSVRDALGYYWPDIHSILRRPDVRVVIDDGRRFLKRTSETFDVITIDPPPPVEAAGSSLLYSEEFYRILETRLNGGGIVQQWTPDPEMQTGQAMVKAIRSVFPHVRVFSSLSGRGYHFLASMQPFTMPTVEEFLARIPPAAAADFAEWAVRKNAGRVYRETVQKEIPLDRFLPSTFSHSLTDDRPFNEYFLLRRCLSGGARYLPDMR